MSQNPSFAEVLFMAPPIHASAGGKSTILERQLHDYGSIGRPKAPQWVDGDGSIHKPFTYKSAASESAHFGVVDLWFAYKDKPGGPYFIKVNTWVFKVTPIGVVAADNKATRLMP